MSWGEERLALSVYSELHSSTGYQKYNVVSIERSLTSTAAGSLDASSTANVVSANFKAYNINWKNTYGAGTQALAVTVNADQVSFYACGFYSYQDTLYAKSGKKYYFNCYIEGATDLTTRLVMLLRGLASVRSLVLVEEPSLRRRGQTLRIRIGV